jgi:DNA-binding MarR family transcriptional regulator
LLEASKLFPDLDPSACEVFLHLMQAGDEAFRVTDAYLAEHHLSQGRFMVLMLLLDKVSHATRSHTPAELADMSGVTRATMTGLIDTLERDELVRREPDPKDRRMLSVHLTPKGEALLQRILPGHFKRMAALMKPLSHDERKTLVQLLSRILQQAVALRHAPAPVA